MTVAQIERVLEREPFQPLRLRLTSGDAYETRNPGLATLLKTRLFVATPDSDDWVLIPLIHIAAIESIGNGHRRRPPTGRL